MNQHCYKIKKIPKIVAIIFFFFFTSPALSPAINGQTIYIYWFVPFLDFDFDTYFFYSILKKVKLKSLVGISIISIFLIFSLDFYMLIKILSIVFCIFYLNYSKKNNYFKYLYLGLNINIVVAIIQFTLYYISPLLAYKWGPTNVSHILFGEYATLTNTNIYSIWGNGFVRVSGWSREAGFFAALLNISIIIYHFETPERKKGQYILFIIGYIISFSKMSLLLPLMFICLWLSQFLNKIPLLVGLMGVFGLLSCFSFVLQKMGLFTLSNISIVHRLIGYVLIYKISIKKFIFGFRDINYLGLDILIKNPELMMLKKQHLFDLCGLPSIIQHFGIFGFGVFYIVLKVLGVTTGGLYLFMLATFDVDPFTATSFVALSYWTMFNLNVFKKINKS